MKQRANGGDRDAGGRSARWRRAGLVTLIVTALLLWLVREEPPVPAPSDLRDLPARPEPEAQAASSAGAGRDGPGVESASAPPEPGVGVEPPLEVVEESLDSVAPDAEDDSAEAATTGADGAPAESGAPSRLVVEADSVGAGAASGGGAGTGGAQSGQGLGSEAATAGEVSSASTSGGEAGDTASPTVVLRTHYEVEFRSGAKDWRPIFARVEAVDGSLTARFPGVEVMSGFLVEPADTRSPYQRERNLPRGRPRLVCTTLEWRAEQVHSVRVRAAFAVDGHARVYFARAGDGGFAEGRYLELPVTGGAGYQDLLFPVAEHPDWSGSVTGLRLDLVNRRRPFLIDRLRAVERVGSGG